MTYFADFEEICQPDAPLAPLTWYKLGGPARWLLSPRDEAELSAVVLRCKEHDIQWRVLGWGANVLVRDAGVDGAVIRLVGPAWEELRWNDPAVYAAAGAGFPRLQRESAERGLAGFENLSGIPGTVGGLIRMNAGGRYGSIGEFVQDVRVMDARGRITVRTAAQVGFTYRHTELGACIVLGATFKLTPGDREAISTRARTIWTDKRASQPAVGLRSAGCIFKNPSVDRPAGLLLDRCGLKGTRLGRAEISTEHANFIVVHEGATAQHVLDLIALARDRVQENEGIALELEVETW